MKTICKFLLLLLPLLVACAKVEMEPTDGPSYTNTVSGYLFERETNKPLAGMDLEVSCLQGSYTNALGGYAITTDSLGKFEIVYTGPSFGRMKVKFPGTTSHGSASTDYFQPFTQKSATLVCAPYGWIKYHIKNVNLWDNNDQIIIRTGGTFQSFSGGVDKTLISKELGNGFVEISYGVIRAGVSTNFVDSVYLPGFDTVFYNIFY